MSRVLEIQYRPRPQFRSYHASDKRFCVTVAHRRAGKTVARINKLIRKASGIDRPFPPGRFGYVAPFRNQAKKIAWMYLKHYAGPFIKAGGKINEQDLVITLPWNGATIELYGADNAEAMRGNYFDGIAADEAQGIARSTLSQIILPCLADYHGWLDCSGTPKGWENLLGELVKMARTSPEDWFLNILRASETGLIPSEELAMQRRIMSEDEYNQEYECDFDAAIAGAIYGKQVARAEKEGRITQIEAGSVAVQTAWDIGYDDPTAIWWYQVLPGEIHVIDYYESSGQDIAHYCEIIKSRGKTCGYTYGAHNVPHDAAHELLAAGGRSIVQQAYELGIKMVAFPPTSQQNAIAAAQYTLDRCWFDHDRCEVGLNALRNYQFEFDEDKKTFRSKPRHDWASHASDAFELLAQAWRIPQKEPAPAKPRFLHEAMSKELFWPEQNTARHIKRI